jgi:hypothetical protein
MQRRHSLVGLAVLVGVLASTGVALAHGGGGLRGAAPDRFVVPTWLFIVTGGGVVGVSFLLASLFTDHDLLADLHAPYARYRPAVGSLRQLAGLLGVLGLVIVVVTGYLGPANPLQNPAILLVWVGWWAGFVMLTYTVGNSWPAVDPFRVITTRLPAGKPRLDLDADRAAWVGAFGLIALFGVEVVSPLAADGTLLAIAALAYLAISVLATRLVGIDRWYGHLDPITRAFDLYGRVAPLGRGASGVTFRLPAAGLAEDVLDGQGGVAFVVALVWGTTYDGLVSTPAWAELAGVVVGVGVPALLLYLGALAFGFGFFLAVYRVSARWMRRTAPTYLATDTLARRFAPSLVAIAAGYHAAHNLTYFLGLLPALVTALLHPFGGAGAATVALPTWVSYLPVVFVLLGHLAAVLVAHAVTFELVPGRLQAIRSQYPLTVVMILYTMTSLWIVSQPTVTPPYL